MNVPRHFMIEEEADGIRACIPHTTGCHGVKSSRGSREEFVATMG